MQHLGRPSQRLAWAITLAAATLASPSWALPPSGLRVDFSKHGSDWTQGNCASRNRQSPIDLNELSMPPSAEFQYKYEEVAGREMKMTNDGRMLSASLADGSLSQLGGIALEFHGKPIWFNLTSIDIKSESEHTLRGKHFPLEIQLVHRSTHSQSVGPESVTVSILVDCTSPPKAPQVWPGLVQKKTRPNSPHGTRKDMNGRLRGNRNSTMLQQTPEESDAVMPHLEADDQEADPMHQRINAEVNFMHSLVEGEDALAAAPAGAVPAAPAPSVAQDAYRPPSPLQPNFNPLLQFLVAKSPPDLDSSVHTAIGPDTPLRLGGLLAGGTYFNYWGSSTLPPCAEKDVWLIKREVVTASTEQVRALYATLHLMSSGAGNFRTIMPVNQRKVQVLAGREGIPRQLLHVPVRKDIEQHLTVLTDKEKQYTTVAKDAITIAKYASDYAKDIDWRIQAGSKAHLDSMNAPAVMTSKPTDPAYIPKTPAEEQTWAAKIMSKVVKNAIHQAVQANIDELVPATASLTTSYLRQRLLKKAGFQPPPSGAKVLPPAPIAGIPTVLLSQANVTWHAVH